MGEEGEGDKNGESRMKAVPCVKQTASGICCVTQGTQTGLTTWRAGRGWEVRRAFKSEGTYVHLWLIHVDIWQKSNQYCKAVTSQLNINT